MSTFDLSLTETEATSYTPIGPTLADVLASLAEVNDVSNQARQNMASGMRTLVRVVDCPAAVISIAALGLRRIMERATPCAAGISATRWRNVKSDVRRAVRISGLTTSEIGSDAPLTEGWESTALLAPDATNRSMIRRLGRYCSARQITPTQVDDDLVRDYLGYLNANQLSRTPERSVSDLIRAWNRHVAGGSSGNYSPLTAPNRSRQYTFDWPDLLNQILGVAVRTQSYRAHTGVYQIYLPNIRVRTVWSDHAPSRCLA